MPAPLDLHAIFLDPPAPTIIRMGALLTGDERRRAAAFHFDRDRRRWIVARASLRVLLGRRLRLAPRDVPLTVAEGGKPHLRDQCGLADLQFNLSHADDHALIALSTTHPVGVDIERFARGRELADCAPAFCSAQELTRLAALDPESKSQFLVRTWCAKEAALKAAGVGLDRSPAGLTIAWPPDGGASLRLDAGPAWEIHFPPGMPAPGYCAAVARPPS